MVARLRTDFWVSALTRRVEQAGAFVSIARHGADEAGAVFVMVDRGDGNADLYGPAPQSVFDEDYQGDRLFSPIAAGVPAETVEARMQQEVRFDSDLWRIDIEDKQGRAFIDLAPDAAGDRFTSR